MDPQTGRKLFFKALCYYKLRASGLNTLVHYRDFRWNETNNNWPLIATLPLMLLFNGAAVVIYVLTRDTLLMPPESRGENSFMWPLTYVGLVLFVVYSSYRFGRATLLLWRMAHGHSFDQGFPPEIKVS